MDSVASRLLAVLGAFGAEHRYLSLTQLSRRTGLPFATSHRLVGELSTWGALERDVQGRYRIGLRLWDVVRAGGTFPYDRDMTEQQARSIWLEVPPSRTIVAVEGCSGPRNGQDRTEPARPGSASDVDRQGRYRAGLSVASGGRERGGRNC